MAQQVFPTKGNLIATKKTLALSTMGYDLMDKKRNILIREMMSLVDQAKRLRDEVDRIYDEVFCLEKEQLEDLKKDLVQKYQVSEQTFPDASDEDKQFLQLFSFICLLSFDVYMKKAVIERLVDQLPKPDPKHDKKKKETT